MTRVDPLTVRQAVNRMKKGLTVKTVGTRKVFRTRRDNSEVWSKPTPRSTWKKVGTPSEFSSDFAVVDFQEVL